MKTISIRHALGPLQTTDSRYYTISDADDQLGDSRRAIDVGRKAAAAVARNISHNQAVAAGYKAFWDAKNRELRDSIRR